MPMGPGSGPMGLQFLLTGALSLLFVLRDKLKEALRQCRRGRPERPVE